MSRSLTADRRSILVLIAVTALLAAVVAVDRLQPSPSGVPGAGLPGEEARADANHEAEEQAESTEKRLEALEEARRNGTLGQQRPAGATAAAGWVGEQPIDTTADDWEPAIAADPRAPYVYALVTRYGTAKPCPGNCPTPWIALEVSADNGATWGPSVPLCACKGSGQFDPIIEVVPNTGHVYALFMKGFNVLFVKSTDHGKTWSEPISTWGNVSWNDKPVLAMSDDGTDVYVSWNGPTGGDAWATVSHDAGATWSQTKLVDSGRYFFAFDADVAADGTVYFSESSLEYGAAGKEGGVHGVVQHHVFVSRDKGATWEDHLVDTVERGTYCEAAGCSADFYLGHTVLSVDAAGTVFVAYDGATQTLAPQSIWTRRSTDGGRTWSARSAISKAGENSTSPALEARGTGDVRVWWMQTNGGNPDAWNVWYRRSTDGGATWSTAAKLSDAGGGAAYKTAAGFLEVYGDYGEIDVMSTGKTIAIWGEGLSWTGPGGVWFNREK